VISFEPSAQQAMVRDLLHQFSATMLRPITLEVDRTKKFPDELLLRIGQMRGAMPGGGSEASEEWTGVERKQRAGPSSSNRVTMIASEALAWGDVSILLNLPGPGLGGPPVRFMGTSEQRQRFFAPFKTGGLHWGAYGLTEPGAGSDVSAIRTSCRRDGDAWILNGRKCFITNGARADWVVIFATIDPALGRAGHRAFVVEKGTPGFSVGKIEEKMGLRASETAELVLEDCRVPHANLLGGDELYRGNEGFMGAMKTFDFSRPTVGIMAVGIARAAYEVARDFARERYLLARPLPRHARIAAMLADAERKIDAARLLCWRAAWMADEGLPNAREASMAKAYAARAAMEVCRDAVEILGAHGLEEGLLVEKWYRDIKVFDIFEGTAQIQKVVIAKRILREPPTF
jgi:acyl-CoA dehydrogenase